MSAQLATQLSIIGLSAIFAFSFYAVLVAGQLSLGQAGFAAIGGFTGASLVGDHTVFGFIPPIVASMVLGAVVGAIVAFVLGLPVLRIRGVYLAIATLAFVEMVRIVFLNLPFTGGAGGTSVSVSVQAQWWTVWIVVALLLYFFVRVGGSRLGRAYSAIRGDELAAQALGVHVARYKMYAVVTSGVIAGVYGVLFTYFTLLITPTTFGFEAAIDGLVTAMVGGTTLFVGPVFGGAFLELIPEAQRALNVQAGWIQPFIAGLLMLLVILFLPGGIAGLIPRRRPPADRADRASLPPRAIPAAGTEIVSMAGLGKSYGGVHAVRGVDLSIAAGEVLGLIGPNGAGKTTLVNMISGLVPPTSGTAEVLGLPLGRRVPAHRFARAGVARTFQHSKLWNEMSAFDNVLVGTHVMAQGTFGRRLVALPSAQRAESAARASAWRQLHRVGLADRAGVRAGQLSYGDQRRLEIARALASDPALLILDEPAAGMNHVEAEQLGALIRELAEGGLTILLIEHNVRMVLSTCTRVMVLNFGEVIAAGDPAEVARDPAVLEAYLGADGDDGADGAGAGDAPPIPTARIDAAVTAAAAHDVAEQGAPEQDRPDGDADE